MKMKVDAKQKPNFQTEFLTQLSCRTEPTQLVYY